MTSRARAHSLVHTEALYKLACDIISTAAEGGINYWATITAYRWQDPDLYPDHTKRDAYLAFHEDDEPEREYHLDGVAVASVLVKILAGSLPEFGNLGYEETFGDRFRNAYAQLGPGEDFLDTDLDYDAWDADCLVQISSLGEVVYG